METLPVKIEYYEGEQAYALFALCGGVWYRASLWYNLPDSLIGKSATLGDVEFFQWDRL